MQKRLIPVIIIKNGYVVEWFNDRTIISPDPVSVAEDLSNRGADEIFIIDLGKNGEEHDLFVEIMRKICQSVKQPVIVGGMFQKIDEIKKLIYAGAKRIVIDQSSEGGMALIETSSQRFGREKIDILMKDFDALFKHRNFVEQYCCEIMFQNLPDIESISNITSLPCLIFPEDFEESHVTGLLKNESVSGVSCRLFSQKNFDFHAFKERCFVQGIKITDQTKYMDFSEIKTLENGLVPVIVRDFWSARVLMLAYMNEEAYHQTLLTGKMTYFSRSRNSLWIKGETSGHYQYLHSLTADCDKDTLLAVVEQTGAACHTGEFSCFFEKIFDDGHEKGHTFQVLEDLYHTVENRKAHPREGSYTNYLLDKGIDKILKKIGEETSEIIIAAKNPSHSEIKYEVADLLYHLTVLMVEKNLTWEEILTELSHR